MNMETCYRNYCNSFSSSASSSTISKSPSMISETSPTLSQTPSTVSKTSSPPSFHHLPSFADDSETMVSSSGGELMATTVSEPGFLDMLLVLDDNVVYPVPDFTNAVDFARFAIKDPSFFGRDEPFFVVDLRKILQQHQIWLQCMPRVQPFYAVKCNNNKTLLRVLSVLGCNFDCASKGEIESVLEVGVTPDRIIYANPCKTASYIKHAASRHVTMMTFDNEPELYKIMKLYPESELVLRIAVSDPTAVCPLNLKFGAEPEQAAPALLKLAATLNANVIGVSFHVGSGCRDPTAFGLGIAYARRLFDYGAQLGFDMRLLDLGGGFPGYKTELAFETIADVIKRSLDVHFPDGCGVRIIAEPGRFYAASAFTLCCTVIARTCVSAERVTKNEHDSDKTGFMYYINDGVYGSFNCILYDHVSPVGYPLLAKPGAQQYSSAVWGPTCDSLDLVQSNSSLPEMQEGDWMVFENMGAYTFAAGSEFNGFPRPSACYIVSDNDNAVLHALFGTTKSHLNLRNHSTLSTDHRENEVGQLTNGHFEGQFDDGHQNHGDHHHRHHQNFASESDDERASTISGSVFSSSSTTGFDTDLENLGL